MYDITVATHTLRAYISRRDWAQQQIEQELARLKALFTDERYMFVARVRTELVKEPEAALQANTDVCALVISDLRTSSEVGGGLEVLTDEGWLPALAIVMMHRLARQC